MSFFKRNKFIFWLFVFIFLLPILAHLALFISFKTRLGFLKIFGLFSLPFYAPYLIITQYLGIYFPTDFTIFGGVVFGDQIPATSLGFLLFSIAWFIFSCFITLLIFLLSYFIRIITSSRNNGYFPALILVTVLLWVVPGIYSAVVESDCSRSSDYRKDECYTTKAMTTKDVSYCSKIHSQFSRTECEKILIRLVNDPKICDSFPSPKNCILNLALFRKDESVCGSDKWCVGAVKLNVLEETKDYHICDSMPIDIDDPSILLTYQCYSMAAKLSLKVNFCENILTIYNNKEKRKIYDLGALHETWNCYSSVAEKTKDFTLCDKIPSFSVSDSNVLYGGVESREACHLRVSRY